MLSQSDGDSAVSSQHLEDTSSDEGSGVDLVRKVGGRGMVGAGAS